MEGTDAEPRGADRDPGPPVTGVLCALPEELGGLAALAVESGGAGWEVRTGEVRGRRVHAVVSGVGKANAAAAAALLVGRGVEELLVVGVCGGLRRELGPGTLVHCTRAVQTDLALRSEREAEPDAGLLASWRAVVPGPAGWFLTADRPVLSAWRRLRLARAFAGPCVADMETAAAAAVCRRTGVRWAALRAVTDGAGAAALLAFRRNYPALAGRAADTLPDLWTARAGGFPEGGARAGPGDRSAGV